jgi:purine-nucleoside phosphorylase
MFGYTGYYKGKRVSVMGSGMGMPSIGIYSYELYKFFDVEKIVRVGSCGALIPELKLFDVVLADGVYSDSSFAYVQNGSADNFIHSSSNLTSKIKEVSIKEGIKIMEGNIYSTDVFTPYKDSKTSDEVEGYSCIAAEMESFALFHTAKILGKEAACLLTVSDSPYIETKATTEEREKSFTQMVELALKSL